MAPLKKNAHKDCEKAQDSKSEPIVLPEEDICFDTELLERVSGIALSGISAASALDLMSQLLANVPDANKGAMDKIKLMDKLINSARHMIETKLKTDDLPAIMKRLDEMEAQIDRQESSSMHSWKNSNYDRNNGSDHG